MKAPKNMETTEKPPEERVEKTEEIGADTQLKAGDGDTTVNEVDLAGTRDVVDERLDRLNKRNAEGHEKNMKAIEEAHKDNDGDEPKSDPNLGREDNGNTPRIAPDGTKTWGPPGVAGARR
jgi:hypothetical protein